MTNAAEPLNAVASADAVLRAHGRSFHFAAKFLGRVHAQRAATVYAFCRMVDDIADEALDAEAARHRLLGLAAAIDRLEPDDDTTAAFLETVGSQPEARAAAQALIQGVLSDLGRVRLDTEAELIRYAYHVAGTVGIMMCAAFDVSDARARPFAIDLGVAMQLTNIARDVMEDAAMDRRYLPARWVDGRSPRQLLEDRDARVAIERGVARALNLAEAFYQSGRSGLGFLPLRARFAVTVAAEVYRAIGGVLRRRGYAAWRGRAAISGPAKVALASRASVRFAFERKLHRCDARHDARLHDALADCPGADHAL